MKHILAVAAMLALSVVSGGAVAARGNAKPQATQPMSVEIFPTYGRGGAKCPARYHIGDRFYASYRVRGFTPNEKDEVGCSLLFNLYDADGNWKAKLASDTFQTARPFLLSHVSGRLKGPAFGPGLEPGAYEVRLTAHDTVSGNAAVGRIPITILPRGIFGAMNIHFTQDTEDKEPCGWLVPLGTPLFLQFQLTGYRESGGRIRILNRYTALKGETGKIVGEQMQIPLEASYAGDPPPWLPINLSGLPPGRYTILLTLEDQLAKEEAKRSGTTAEQIAAKTTATYRIPLVIVAPPNDTIPSTVDMP